MTTSKDTNMEAQTLEEALADMPTADGTTAPEVAPADAPMSLEDALSGLGDNVGDLSLEDALSDMGPADPSAPSTPAPTEAPEMTAEQEALTPGYYAEHGEPGLGHPSPGPFALATAAEAGLLGGYTGALEIKDLFAGELEGGRPGLDAARRRIEEQSPIIGPVAEAIGQFAVGIFGLKGTGAAVKALPWFGRGLKAGEAALHARRGGALAAELGRDATALYITSDPHTERLANLLEDTPYVGPVADFLAADPNDGPALGRFKAALEGMAMDVALRGALVGSVAAFKALWHGDAEGAAKATLEAEAELKEAVQSPEPPAHSAAPDQQNLRSIGADNQNLSRSRGIVGSTEALPEEGSRFAIPAADNGTGAAPEAANLNPKTPDILADNDQPRPQSDGVAAVEMGEPREGYATQGVYSPGAASGTPEAANANSVAVRTGGNDNAAFGPAPETSVRSGGERPDLSPDEEVALEVGGLGGTQRPKAGPKKAPRAAPANDPLPGTVKAPQGSTAPAILASDEDTDALLTAMRSDVEALEKHGSRGAAEAAGHKFGAGESIPYAKLTTVEDRDAFLARMVDAETDRIVSAKGGAVVHDADVAKVAGERAKLFGEDPSAFLGKMQGSADAAVQMVANAEAGRIVVNQLSADLTKMARLLSFGDWSSFGGQGPAYEAFAQRYAFLREVYSATEAITSNSARATRLAGIRLEVDPMLANGTGSLDIERLIGAFANSDGSATSIAALAKPSLFAKGMDAARFVFINNLLSGWKTMAVNALSNVGMVGLRPMERLAGAAPGALGGNTASGTIVRQAVRQYAYTTSALMDGFQSAVTAFKTGDSVIAPRTTELYNKLRGPSQDVTVQPWKPVASTEDVLHNAFVAASMGAKGGMLAQGLPTRVMGFFDELTKQTVGRSYVMAEAHVAGLDEAARLGLKGREAKTFVRDFTADKLAKAFDAEGRMVHERGFEEALISTFSQDLIKGTWGRTIQEAKLRHPNATFILPFVKSPTNILRYGWKMTPGLNLAQKEYLAMLKGANGSEAQAQAMGQMALGTSAILATAALSSMGTITGAGPMDPKLRQELLATGWQPYSVVVEKEDGTKRYHSYGRFDPVAISMGIVADIQDAIHATGGDLADAGMQEKVATMSLALTVALTKQFRSKSYVSGFSQFLNALSDPDERAGPYAGQLASNFVPFASMLRQTDTDPYMREARGFVDKVVDTIPGLGTTLPARYDAFGDPIVSRNGLWSSDTDAVVDREMQRLVLETDAAPTRVSPTPQAGVDLRDLTMADGPFAGRNAYEVYQYLSGHLPNRPTLKDMAAQLIQSPDYQMAPDGDAGTRGTKLSILTGLMGEYRREAMGIMKRDPALREAFTRRERKVKEAYREQVAVGRSAMPLVSKGVREGAPEGRPGIGEAFGVELGKAFDAEGAGAGQ